MNSKSRCPGRPRSVSILLHSLLVASGFAVAGCGTSRETSPTAPNPGSPQLEGVVNRSGDPVASMKVKLFDDTTGAQVDSTFTDAAGVYGFSDPGAGQWMVKVSPTEPGDFGYVRYFVSLTSATDRAVIPPFDVSAHGLGAVAPDDGASTPVPDFSSPLRFTWSAYQASYLGAEASLSDAAGLDVWTSPRSLSTQADWNGLGTDGSYAGRPVPAGGYQWRVKARLANGVHAATRVRALVLR